MVTYKRPTPVLISKNQYDPSSECWKQQHLKVKEIQHITKGEGAVLCFIDDGIGQNTELIGKIENPVFSYLENSNWEGEHSTAGATIVGGTTIGIFPKMKFISKQVLDPQSGAGTSSSIVSAIRDAKDKGIRCINLSLGSDSPDPAIEKALIEYCSNGINIATIAAGNDSKMTDYPAQYAKTIKGVLSVAATQIDNRGKISIASFSSFGVVTISAPGHALKSMTLDSIIDFVSGTSFAAPIVGSAIAVMQSLRPTITQDEILTLLSSTAVDIGSTLEHQGSGTIDILTLIKRVLDPADIAVKIPEPINKRKPFWKKWFC